MLTSLPAMAAALLPVLLVWAGAVDLLTRSIPNSIVLFLSGGFVLFAGVEGLSFVQIVAHAVCALIVLVFGFALFSRSLIGGGDAKLLSAAALWLGFGHLLPLLAGTALAGGVLSLAFLAAHGLRFKGRPVLLQAQTIPYGAAIAAGALAAIPEWVSAF
jgi:prepilin peptidase CpaA